MNHELHECWKLGQENAKLKAERDTLQQQLEQAREGQAGLQRVIDWFGSWLDRWSIRVNRQPHEVYGAWDTAREQAALAAPKGGRLRCTKCGSSFDEIGGKKSRDGDVTQWCPKCGAGDDHIHECDCEDYEHGLVSNECPVHNLHPAPKGEAPQMFYLMENREGRRWNGNCAVFWRPNSAGYTCWLDKAGKYTADEAEEHKMHPELVTVVPVEIVESVMHQCCDYNEVQQALKASQPEKP